VHDAVASNHSRLHMLLQQSYSSAISVAYMYVCKQVLECMFRGKVVHNESASWQDLKLLFTFVEQSLAAH